MRQTLKTRLDNDPQLWRPTGLPPGPVQTALIGVSAAKPVMASFIENHPQISVKQVAFVDYKKSTSPSKILFKNISGATEVIVGDIKSLVASSHLAKIFIACGDYKLDRRAAGKVGRFLAAAGFPGFIFGGRYNFNQSRFYDPEFFNKHESRLEAVYSLLADDLSRSILVGLVKARLTDDCGYIPISSYEEYFHPALKITKNEQIIDGGVSGNLAETLKFSNKVGPSGSVVGFEPNFTAYETALAGLAKREVNNVHLVNLGLWHEIDSLPFVGNGMGAHLLSPAEGSDNSLNEEEALNQVTCRLTSLDTYCLENKLLPSVIKLDVEGSELAALRGAEGVIREKKPKLIICLYHKEMDFIEIIEWLAQLRIGYQFFLGHHFINDYETILYAM